MHGEPAFNRPERTNRPFPLQMVRTIGCLTDVEFLFDSGANTHAMQDSSLLSHSTKPYIGQVHAVGGSGLGSDPGDLLLSFGDSSDVLLVEGVSVCSAISENILSPQAPSLQLASSFTLRSKASILWTLFAAVVLLSRCVMMVCWGVGCTFCNTVMPSLIAQSTT